VDDEGFRKSNVKGYDGDLQIKGQPARKDFPPKKSMLKQDEKAYVCSKCTTAVTVSFHVAINIILIRHMIRTVTFI
jgi:hypothetical protein